ncbi:MAG: Uncharacterized protein FD146_1263 [Anaerolineaceae bacterium]|nr:MAG: Uncharacterized protein FD146_1263 [Anaerolineaceae bacterium]
MPRRLTFLFLTLLLLAACAPQATPEPAPDLAPAPGGTGTAVTAAPSEPVLPGPSSAAPTSAPSATPEPTLVFPTLLPVTLEPSATPQLSPALSSAAIQILSPGPLSKVRTPIRMRGYVLPGARNMIRVELYGEDGRLIFRKLTPVFTEFKWAYFTMDIPFETRAAAELARLQVSTDDENGSAVALLSVHLLLLSEGYEELNPPGSLDERCTLLIPLAGATASGGTLAVAGEYRPYNTQPLIVELVTADGAIVANRWFAVPAGAEGGLMPFSADLAYSVDAPVAARLVVRQRDDRINGNIYLFSQPVILNP